jgi:hypothetical protein
MRNWVVNVARGCRANVTREPPDVSKVLEAYDVQVERQQYAYTHDNNPDEKSTH